MKWIAIIVVVGIIALAVILGLLIQRLKNRQAEELKHLQGQLGLTQNQLAVSRTALRTIRDLQGDSSFDAQMALDENDRLLQEYYDNQEGIAR